MSSSFDRRIVGYTRRDIQESVNWWWNSPFRQTAGSQCFFNSIKGKETLISKLRDQERYKKASHSSIFGAVRESCVYVSSRL